MPFDDLLLEDELRHLEVEFVTNMCQGIPIVIDSKKEEAKLMLDSNETVIDAYIQSAMSVLDTQLTGKLGRKVIEALQLAKRT